MLKKILAIPAAVLALIALYLMAWPVPVEPVAWQAPRFEGYAGPHAPNTRLAGAETLSLQGLHGPECIALDAEGRIYATTHEGFVLRMNADGSHFEKWANTQGRPLGIRFDRAGNLIVADAYRGLLSITPAGVIAVLAAEADGVPIRYADDLDLAPDGRIYFSDASTKFGAREFGGTYEGSLLDIMEHGGHGRLLVYDPATGKTTTVLKGLNFANGVAVSGDGSFVLVNETGSYKVTRYWLAGAKQGQAESLIENLPGFPDNISRGQDGRFWIALVSPRNALLDRLSDFPFARKMIQRLPASLRPQAVPFSHIVAVNAAGKVVADLQDAKGAYPIVTSVTESDRHLYLGSLVTDVLARVNKASAGL